MKQKDILTIVVIAGVSAILSFFAAKAFFGGEKVYKLTSPNVPTISSEFKSPDTAYFNKDSLNLTKNIQIGDSTNQKPIKNSQ